MIPGVSIDLSGDRFRVIYRIKGGEAEARRVAADLGAEQTVEFPAELLPTGDLRDQIVGRIEALEILDETYWQASISYRVEAAGGERAQLLNVVFGNYSLKPGVRVERLELPEVVARAIGGPRFGRDGLRSLVGVGDRPLLCTAIKPMGLPSRALADLTFRLALGGIDLIKDDHGLANQPFAPFAERVQRCAEAVARANRETGQHSIYLPNVTADGDIVRRNARLAKSAGAGGILIAPGLAGLGTMARLARDDRLGLPIMSHPAFQGSYVINPAGGLSHGVLFGQIARLAGADASIFPNYGGRFSFTPDECREIAHFTSAPLGNVKASFPAPGGGMTLSRVPDLLDFYGCDVILLIGAGLHQPGPDLIENCRAFRRLVERLLRK